MRIGTPRMPSSAQPALMAGKVERSCRTASHNGPLENSGKHHPGSCDRSALRGGAVAPPPKRADHWQAAPRQEHGRGETARRCSSGDHHPGAVQWSSLGGRGHLTGGMDHPIGSAKPAQLISAVTYPQEGRSASAQRSGPARDRLSSISLGLGQIAVRTAAGPHPPSSLRTDARAKARPHRGALACLPELKRPCQTRTPAGCGQSPEAAQAQVMTGAEPTAIARDLPETGLMNTAAVRSNGPKTCRLRRSCRCRHLCRHRRPCSRDQPTTQVLTTTTITSVLLEVWY